MNLPLENYFLKAFTASALLALVMMAQALGLMYLFKYGTPLPVSIVLIMAAVAFILSASFFERYEVGSMPLSVMVSVIITLILTLVSGGVVYLSSVGHPAIDDIASGTAVCMMISMGLLNFLKRSLGEIEY